MSRLEQIRRRWIETSDGPWEHDARLATVTQKDGDGDFIAELGWCRRSEANGDFIAHAPEDVEYLLAEVSRLQVIARAASDAYPLRYVIDGEHQGKHLCTLCEAVGYSSLGPGPELKHAVTCPYELAVAWSDAQDDDA